MSQAKKKQPVYFISDNTGLSTETVGKMLITQFQDLEFSTVTMPFIKTKSLALKSLEQIHRETYQQRKKDSLTRSPIILSTLINTQLREVFSNAGYLYLDLFEMFLPKLESLLQSPATGEMGLAHALDQDKQYSKRMSAVNFTLNYDDGAHPGDYSKAEVILIGLSRSGKTPTCLYLALQFGIKAANYPIIPEEESNEMTLPKSLEKHKSKLFGLIINPKRLQALRHERIPFSDYSALNQCQKENDFIQKLYAHYHLPFLDSTDLSVEELSTKIMKNLGLTRNH
jgi:regulator of PEP synthase PpsR (kinase-PPPase family)